MANVDVARSSPEARCPRNVMPRAVSPHRCPEGRRKQCWEGNGSLALVFGRPEPPAGLGLPQSGDAGASCLRGPRLRRAAVAPVWKLESRTWRGTAFVCWRVSRASGRKGSGEPISYCRNNSLVPERHVNAPPRYSLGLVREVRHIKNNDFPREPSCFALKTHGGVRKTIYSIVVEPGAND